jgi:putative DNA primase/helicase
MLDFNDAPTLASGYFDFTFQRDELKRELLARLPSVLMALFPAGKFRGNKFLIGNIQGDAGDSLEILLDGDKAGLWFDHENGEGGDIFDAIAIHHGLDSKNDFAAVMEVSARLVGRSLVTAMPVRTEVQVDELGPHTAKWDYT